jgi:dolichol kinase
LSKTLQGPTKAQQVVYVFLICAFAYCAFYSEYLVATIPSRQIRPKSNPRHAQGHMTHAVAFFFFLGLFGIGFKHSKSQTEQRTMLQALGVHIDRIRRSMKEIERKTFHTTGLFVPLSFNLFLQYGGQLAQIWGLASSEACCVRITWLYTLAAWSVDVLRISSPALARKMPLQNIIRPHEQGQLTGMCWFSLGVSLSITLFDPEIATTSIMMLVLGDMFAALVGVAFGGEAVVIKLGRRGKKSVEGSFAMFCVCFIVG